MRSKSLVLGPGAQKKPFGYQVIDKNSLTSCPGQIKDAQKNFLKNLKHKTYINYLGLIKKSQQILRRLN